MLKTKALSIEFLLACVCLWCLQVNVAMSAEKALVLAVHPYLPESEIQKRF